MTTTLRWGFGGVQIGDSVDRKFCAIPGATQCVSARRVSLYLLDPEEIWELNYATVSIVFLPVATSYLT